MKLVRPTKAMVLAAGLGTRLHPITLEIPKPLVEVLNVPNILHSLFLLKKAGIREVIVNLHYLPEKIERFLGNGSAWGLHIEYSRESVLLGTGGGLKKAEPFFNSEPFLLVNCDFVSNTDLLPIIDQHLARKAIGTMVLYQNPFLQPLYSEVGVDANENLCSLPGKQIAPPVASGIFTGIHILGSEVFHYLSEKPCGINEVLYPALMQQSPQKIYGHFMKGFWRDTGDLPALWKTSIDLMSLLCEGDPTLREFMETFGHYREVKENIWLAQGETIPKGLHGIGPLILGKQIQCASETRVGPQVILSDFTKVGPGTTLSQCLALGRAEISLEVKAQRFIQYHRTTLEIS